VLGLKRDTEQDAIKRAYRRLARQWHPDVCQEPDAAEQFMRIQHAYEVLSDPRLRARYEAGLALEASIGRSGDNTWSLLSASAPVWRAPLRCGWVLAEGYDALGRFTVARIVQWEDIVDGQGRVMTSFWPAGADHFQVQFL